MRLCTGYSVYNYVKQHTKGSMLNSKLSKQRRQTCDYDPLIFCLAII